LTRTQRYWRQLRDFVFMWVAEENGSLMRVVSPRAGCHTVHGIALHVTYFSLFSKLIEARPYQKHGSHFKACSWFVGSMKHSRDFRNEKAHNASVSCIVFVRQTVSVATPQKLGFREI